MRALAMLVFALLVSCIRSAMANDSFAAVGAGGIVLQKTDGISMESENLYLSLTQVRVRYMFANNSGQDVATTVAFPIPEITIDDPDDMNNRFLTETNPMKFHVSVNGKAVATKLERKKIQDGVYQLTYYWDQLFPKDQRVVVEHQYQPVIGGFLYDPKQPQRAVKEYCIEPGLKQSLEKIAARRAAPVVPTTELQYVLSTGSHWQGPIKDFRMVIDKGRVDRFLSLCIDGIQKIGPTQFELHQHNYLPTRDIRAVFFEPQ